MPSVGYVVVSTQPSRADAELLAGLLRSGGISVVIQGGVDAEYPTTVGGGYRVEVPSERAVDAQQLLARAEHVDPTDPASSLDVGLPVDEEVRDYLAWKAAPTTPRRSTTTTTISTRRRILPHRNTCRW